MTPSARIQSAIDVLTDLIDRRRPAADALKDWGLGHRFAGSKDRAAIASLVYDAMRVRASAAYLMGEETPRAIMIGALRRIGNLDLPAISVLCDDTKYGAAALTEAESARLSMPDPLPEAPLHIRADAPEWLVDDIGASLGGDVEAELRALGTRAPTDIRINTLKTLRDKMRPEIMHLNPIDTQWSPMGMRFSAGENGRGPALQALPEFVKGQFEIQDEGSQVVALMTQVEPGSQVVDLCAGGGGKTLALSAMMNNTGQIYATDNDARRLAPIHARMERAGVRNVQVRTPRSKEDETLQDLAGKIDLVVIDAPCTGTGTWRRNPDAKWRIRPGALAERIKDQDAVLARAARLAAPGGRIAYITCSVLAAENEDRVAAFLAVHANFKIIPPEEVLAHAPDALSERTDLIGKHKLGLQLTPHRTQTDGFFLAMLRRDVG
jgi:16S rRNA (cytosine967-C5)-methyltransferase